MLTGKQPSTPASDIEDLSFAVALFDLEYNVGGVAYVWEVPEIPVVSLSSESGTFAIIIT